MSTQSEHHIKSIYLSKLFGRYTYEVPKQGGALSDLNILYGENGLGKTSLLSLIFHLLSPARNKNHKTAISAILFHELRVTLNDGTTITATKDPQLLTGPVSFAIASGTQLTEWRFSPNARSSIVTDGLPEYVDVLTLPVELRVEVTQALAERKFFTELSKLQAAPFMLTSDRILLGDSIESQREIRRTSVQEAASRSKVAEIVSDYRVGAVTQALASASSWLQTKFVERSYGAGESASRVYQDVVKRIAKTPYKTSAGLNKIQQAKLRESLIAQIDNLNQKSKEFSSFGFARMSITSVIRETVAESSGNKLHLIENVLSPHLAELKARLDSIDPVYQLASGFVKNVNKFFHDKTLKYSLRHGVQIFSSDDGQEKNPMTPSQLSSGEQQLILIFCSVLTARDTPNIFIIDEPEISLNIMWQRMLISSLQELSHGSQTQLIFASHSMEILAKHRSRVVTLDAV